MLTIDGTGDEAQAATSEVATTLDQVAREGARRMILAALEEEVEAYRQRHQAACDARGHALVVRNGRAQPRRVTLGRGTITLRAPRINDRRVVEGVRQKFTSQILPPYLRRSPNVSGVLPLLYLHGLSSGDFEAALPVLLGEDAAGLSPAAITRLTVTWRREYAQWRQRSFASRDYIYLWVDGVHFNIRLEEDRLAALVVIGVRADGTKELLALEDGYRESTESWLAVLRDLKARGLPAPALAIGDGALGFWAAVREVWPETAGTAVLGAPDRQRARQTADAAAGPGQTGLARDDVCRDPASRRGGDAAVCHGVRGQISQSCEGAVRRCAAALDAL